MIGRRRAENPVAIRLRHGLERQVRRLPLRRLDQFLVGHGRVLPVCCSEGMIERTNREHKRKMQKMRKTLFTQTT